MQPLPQALGEGRGEQGLGGNLSLPLICANCPGPSHLKTIEHFSSELLPELGLLCNRHGFSGLRLGGNLEPGEPLELSTEDKEPESKLLPTKEPSRVRRHPPSPKTSKPGGDTHAPLSGCFSPVPGT